MSDNVDAEPNYGFDVAVDLDDNVILTGTYSHTLSFGGDPLTSVSGADAIFLAKYTAAGAFIEDQSFGGYLDTDVAYGVTSDTQNSVLLGGHFAESIDFGGGVLTSAALGKVALVK